MHCNYVNKKKFIFLPSQPWDK